MAAVVLGITADALEEYTPNSLASPLSNCFISIAAFSMRLRKQFGSSEDDTKGNNSSSSMLTASSRRPEPPERNA